MHGPKSIAGAMQPVCSLRLHHLRFKQATNVWRHRHRLQQQALCTHIFAPQQASTGSKGKPLRRPIACSDAAVPHIPCSGDNQAGAFFATLSQNEDASSSSSESVDDTHLPTSTLSNNGGPPDKKPEPRIPHRWRIVGMMSLAFVLCNMDKVC